MPLHTGTWSPLLPRPREAGRTGPCHSLSCTQGHPCLTPVTSRQCQGHQVGTQPQDRSSQARSCQVSAALRLRTWAEGAGHMRQASTWIRHTGWHHSARGLTRDSRGQGGGREPRAWKSRASGCGQTAAALGPGELDFTSSHPKGEGGSGWVRDHWVRAPSWGCLQTSALSVKPWQIRNSQCAFQISFQEI